MLSASPIDAGSHAPKQVDPGELANNAAMEKPNIWADIGVSLRKAEAT